MGYIIVFILFVIAVIVIMNYNKIFGSSKRNRDIDILEAGPRASAQPAGQKKTMTPYKDHKYEFHVVGIGYERSQIKAWDSLNKGDMVYVVPEPNNSYDKNALAVLDKNRRRVGYVPRNQRKLILTIRENPHTFAKVLSKFYREDHRSGKRIYDAQVELWVGFDKEVIEKEIANHS